MPRIRSRSATTVGGGGGEPCPECPPASGFIASIVGAAVHLTNRFSLTAFEQKPAFAVTCDRHSVSIPQNPALVVSRLAVTGSASTAQTPAIDVDLAPTTISPAVHAVNSTADILQVIYGLNRRVGANASADVTGTWTTRANAEGIHNNTDATSTGAVSAATRKMSMSYANHVNKTDLTITQVIAHIYIQSAGNTGALLGSISCAYNVGAGEVNFTGWTARTDTFDFTTTPNDVDITAIIGGDWAKLDAFQAFVTHVYAAVSNTFVCSVDAIELEIIASKTDSPPT